MCCFELAFVGATSPMCLLFWMVFPESVWTRETLRYTFNGEYKLPVDVIAIQERDVGLLEPRWDAREEKIGLR